MWIKGTVNFAFAFFQVGEITVSLHDDRYKPTETENGYCETEQKIVLIYYKYMKIQTRFVSKHQSSILIPHERISYC